MGTSKPRVLSTSLVLQSMSSIVLPIQPPQTSSSRMVSPDLLVVALYANFCDILSILSPRNSSLSLSKLHPETPLRYLYFRCFVLLETKEPRCQRHYHIWSFIVLTDRCLTLLICDTIPSGVMDYYKRFTATCGLNIQGITAANISVQTTRRKIVGGPNPNFLFRRNLNLTQTDS